ncbi:hypothetical protein [Cupriavidus laharis]
MGLHTLHLPFKQQIDQNADSQQASV